MATALSLPRPLEVTVQDCLLEQRPDVKINLPFCRRVLKHLYKFGVIEGFRKVKDDMLIREGLRQLLGIGPGVLSLAGSSVNVVMYSLSHPDDPLETVSFICDTKFGIGILLSSGSLLVTGNTKRLAVPYTLDGVEASITPEKVTSRSLRLNTLDMYGVQLFHTVVKHCLNSDTRLTSSVSSYRFWMTASVAGAENATTAMYFAMDAMASMLATAEANVPSKKKLKAGVLYEPCPPEVLATLPVLDPVVAPVPDTPDNPDLFDWQFGSRSGWPVEGPSSNQTFIEGLSLFANITTPVPIPAGELSIQAVSAIHSFCHGKDRGFLLALADTIRCGFIQRDVPTDGIPQCPPGMMPQWALAVDELTVVLARSTLQESQLFILLHSFLGAK